MNDAPPAASSAEPPPEPAPRVRLTSVAATLASIAVVVAFFLPWVAVPAEQARLFREAIVDRLDDPERPPPPGVAVDDWRRLADLVVDQGGRISGLDVFYWARTARTTAVAMQADTIRADARPVDPGGEPRAIRREESKETAALRSTQVSRALLVVAVAVGALPVVAVLVAALLLLGRWRHAASPVLVLALLTGAVAVALPAGYSIVAPALGFSTEADAGLVLLLPAGGALVLAGIFGMRRRNWWRIAAGTLLLGGLLGMLAWGYVASGA